MAYQRALGMVDTNGDGIANAVGYDTKGDGCVSPRTHTDSGARCACTDQHACTN